MVPDPLTWEAVQQVQVQLKDLIRTKLRMQLRATSRIKSWLLMTLIDKFGMMQWLGPLEPLVSQSPRLSPCFQTLGLTHQFSCRLYPEPSSYTCYYLHTFRLINDTLVEAAHPRMFTHRSFGETIGCQDLAA